MLTKYKKALSHIALIALCISLFLIVCRNSSQEKTTVLSPNVFRGQYCHAGEAWVAPEDTSTLSALDGDVWFRGHFEREIPEGDVVYFYVNHIAYSITVNGECLSALSCENHKISSGLCAEKWIYFVSPGITPDDLVEIHLSNPHRFGNANAYSAFLGSFYTGPYFEIEHTLQTMLAQKCAVYRGIGTLIFILSIGIMGVALVFSFLRISFSNMIWSLGLLSFFAGGYIALDTIDLSLWSRLYTFNNYALLLCIMLGAFELGVFICTILSDHAKRVSFAAIVLEGIFLAALSLLCATDRILLYDALPYWCALQLILCPSLLACCIYERCKIRKAPPVLLSSAALLLITSVADILSITFLWWPTGFMTKWVFIFLFIFHLANGFKTISETYQKAAEAEKLKDDLANSRIVMATNQIRTHFIFNVLNAISGMCKYDPEKADRTIVRFSRYLRANIDILQDDQPVTFHSALQHMEDYIALEQIRFGEKIQFETDIRVSCFKLPPLILQPLVENAIKHGLTPKPSGGTITLRTWTEKNSICIAIEDDGVGFDPDALESDRSVGLNNVRFRLRHMVQGELKIESTPGCGTTATIFIPCEEAETCM